eukprot:8024793-Pyramimonas_sp.AAC.2
MPPCPEACDGPLEDKCTRLCLEQSRVCGAVRKMCCHSANFAKARCSSGHRPPRMCSSACTRNMQTSMQRGNAKSFGRHGGLKRQDD